MSVVHSSPERDPGGHLAGVVLRLVFAAIFGTTGFLLGREAYDRAISIHVANQWWQFAAVVIAPVIGAVLGVLIVPMAQRVFERELVAVERANSIGWRRANSSAVRSV